MTFRLGSSRTELFIPFSSQLRNIRRNLGYPSVETQIRVIESAELQDVPLDTRKQVFDIVKHCHACQLRQGKPRRFLFSIRDSVAGGFNQILQINIVMLADGNVLHILDVETRLQNGGSMDGMATCTAWVIVESIGPACMHGLRGISIQMLAKTSTPYVFGSKPQPWVR